VASQPWYGIAFARQTFVKKISFLPASQLMHKKQKYPKLLLFFIYIIVIAIIIIIIIIIIYL
jgi:hypothetical protein